MKKYWFFKYSVQVGHFFENHWFFKKQNGVECMKKVRVLQVFSKSLSFFEKSLVVQAKMR